jgi:hypothetical protein
MSFTIRKLRETNFGHMIVELVGNSILTLKLIWIDVDLQKELEQFEGAFERDEIMVIKTVENIFKVYFFVKKKLKNKNFSTKN